MPRPANGKQYELTKDGELVVAGYVGSNHELIKLLLNRLLTPYCTIHQEGYLCVESLFALSASSARIPDLAYLSPESFAQWPKQDGPIPLTPEFVIEIISLSESASDVEDKAREYLASGVREVWQVWMKQKFVRVRTKNQTIDFQEGDVIETPILPGLQLPVAPLFQHLR